MCAMVLSMGTKACDAALGEAGQALKKARKALGFDPQHPRPEASAAWYIEQAQRQVGFAMDALHPAPKADG